MQIFGGFFLERNITHLSRCGFANPQGLSLSGTSDDSDESDRSDKSDLSDSFDLSDFS